MKRGGKSVAGVGRWGVLLLLPAALFLPKTSNSLSLRCFGARGVEFWRKNGQNELDLPLKGGFGVANSTFFLLTFRVFCHGNATFGALPTAADGVVKIHDSLPVVLYI